MVDVPELKKVHIGFYSSVKFVENVFQAALVCPPVCACEYARVLLSISFSLSNRLIHARHPSRVRTKRIWGRTRDRVYSEPHTNCVQRRNLGKSIYFLINRFKIITIQDTLSGFNTHEEYTRTKYKTMSNNISGKQIFT